MEGLDGVENIGCDLLYEDRIEDGYGVCVCVCRGQDVSEIGYGCC